MYTFMTGEFDFDTQRAVSMRCCNRRHAARFRNRPHRRVMDEALAKHKLKEWFRNAMR